MRAPQGASGEKELVDWLMSLPGFDIDAMTRAMQYRGNATFELWKAPYAEGSERLAHPEGQLRPEAGAAVVGRSELAAADIAERS